MSAPVPEPKAALGRLLAPLIKLALVGDGDHAAAWRTEAAAAQREVAAAIKAVAALRLDDVWSQSVRTAECDPAVRRGETVNPTLPTMSPLRFDQLGATPFDLEGAVQTIRDVASFG